MVPEQKPQYNPWLQSIFLETGLINLCGSSMEVAAKGRGMF